MLRKFCDVVGLRQLVKEPTRGENLLDLALTDLDKVKCKVVGKIADHKGLLLVLPLAVPRVAIQRRIVWDFQHADWNGLRSMISLTDWSWLSSCNANDGASQLTTALLQLAGFFIPQDRLIWQNPFR